VRTPLVFALAFVVCVQALSAQDDPRVRLLNRLGCPDCHAVAFLKIKGQADVGPDLSAAYAEVPYRYGIPFERFFDQSPAMMRFVLGTRPPLKRAERDSLIALFRGLYLEQLARLDSARRQARPVRAGEDALPKPRR
jgi:hypothetical protein